MIDRRISPSRSAIRFAARISTLQFVANPGGRSGSPATAFSLLFHQAKFPLFFGCYARFNSLIDRKIRLFR